MARLTRRTEAARRGRGTTRIDRPGDAALPKLKPGHVRCPRCLGSAGLAAANNTMLRAHTDPDGFPCGNRVADLDKGIVRSPLTVEERGLDDARRAKRTGHCVDCGKPVLPGLRTVCGACAVARGKR